MAPRYEVRLRDTAGAYVAIFDDWIKLEIQRNINGPDEHTFVVNGLDSRVALFALDVQLEVWRKDDVAGIAKYLEYEGFHRITGEQQDERGQSIFTSQGVGYEDLLDRRIVQGYFQSTEATKGPIAAETAMKEYANEQAGPGATVPPRLFEAGVTLGLAIQADAAAGGNWSGSMAYRNLLDVERDISESMGMWFDVIGTGAATFQFRAGVLPYGSDRTITGLVAATGLNGAGNRPVIFSNILGTVRKPQYSLIRHKETNRCLALGSGHADNRLLRHIIPVPDPGLDSPWNKRETKSQVAEMADAAALDDKATGTLEIGKSRQRFDFEVEQAEPLLYGRDYFLGDTVTAVYNSITANRTIVGVNISVQRSGGQLSEDIKLQLADVISTANLGTAPLEALNNRVRDLESLDYSSAGGGTSWDNVLIVAKDGGDFTTITAALNSIIDNAANNRYCIFVCPGDYSENVTMKQWIDIWGISKKAVSINPVAGVAVTMVANTILGNLSVIFNTASTIGIQIPDDDTCEVFHVDVTGLFTITNINCAGGGKLVHVHSIGSSPGNAALTQQAGGSDTLTCIDCQFIGAAGSPNAAYGAEVRDATKFYNCRLQGDRGLWSAFAGAVVYCQNCTIVGDGNDNSLLGGGIFDHCSFQDDVIANGGNFNLFCQNCDFDNQTLTLTSTAQTIFRNCTRMDEITCNSLQPEFHNCDRVEIVAMNMSGACIIRESYIVELAYTGGVHSVDLDGNSYGQAPATNANRTITGQDLQDLHFPTSSLGTGAYTTHGNKPVMELNATEACYIETELPRDALILLEAVLVYIPTGAGTWDWTVDTLGGACGEDEATHNDSDTGNGEATVDDRIQCLDITAAFTPYNPGDFIGCEVTCDALGGGCTSINIKEIRFQVIKSN